MRLNRFLARAGLASRRKAEEIILSGKVSVNGEKTNKLATEIDLQRDTVEVGGEIVELPAYQYYLLNKPAGYTCTRSDVHARKTIFELLPEDKSLFSVGRLDRETTGLLLITNDGNFAQNIIHPSKKIGKVYRVCLREPISSTQLDKLREPIKLDDGPVKVLDYKKTGDKEIELTIEEGRKRIIRRIVKALGGVVAELERIKIGELALDIPQGEYRSLTPKEIQEYV